MNGGRHITTEVAAGPHLGFSHIDNVVHCSGCGTLRPAVTAEATLSFRFTKPIEKDCPQCQSDEWDAVYIPMTKVSI